MWLTSSMTASGPLGGNAPRVGATAERRAAGPLLRPRRASPGRAGLPDPHGPVHSAGDDATVRGVRDGPRPIGMAKAGLDHFARFEVPDPDHGVVTARHRPAAVRREGHGADGFG